MTSRSAYALIAGFNFGVAIWCFVIMNYALANEHFGMALLQGILGIANMVYAFLNGSEVLHG